MSRMKEQLFTPQELDQQYDLAQGILKLVADSQVAPYVAISALMSATAMLVAQIGKRDELAGMIITWVRQMTDVAVGYQKRSEQEGPLKPETILTANNP